MQHQNFIIPCRSNPMPYYVGHIPEPDYYTLPLTFENVSDNDSASFYIRQGGNQAILNLKCSTDGGTTWNTLSYNSTVTLQPSGKAMISGINSTIGSSGDWNAPKVVTSGNGKLKVYGNINSLGCDSQGNFGTGQYVFYGIFKDCLQLVDAYNLKFPSQYIPQQGYISLFQGCTALTAGPKRIDGQVNGNWTMCNMFSGCTNLVFASEIATTVINTNTFQDFCRNCSHLQKAPFINATTYATGGQLFWWCFMGCSSLSAIELKFTTFPPETSNWVNGVAPTGLFIVPYNYSGSTSRGTSSIPSNWLILKRQSDGSLKYGQSYNGHSEGEDYNGEYGADPYAEYYK